MNTKENEEFIDGLQGKIYVSVIIDYSTKPKVSERMTLEEAMIKYKKLHYEYGHCKPNLGQIIYIARASNPEIRLEGTDFVII